MNQTKNNKKGGRVADRGDYPLHPRDLLACITFWGRLYAAVDEAVEAWLTRPRIGDVKPATGAVTFKPRHHFRANGTPKVKRTLAGAQRFAQEHPGTQFYECSVCGAYHVGHKVKARGKKFRAGIPKLQQAV